MGMAGNKKGQCSAGTWKAKPCIRSHTFSSLNLTFEVFSNKMAFIFVGPLQPALYHIYNTWKRESSPRSRERMVCMASDGQN